MQGMGPMHLPDGSKDTDGDLSVTAFSKRQTVKAEAEAKAEARAELGEEAVEVDNAQHERPVEAAV